MTAVPLFSSKPNGNASGRNGFYVSFVKVKTKILKETQIPTGNIFSVAEIRVLRSDFFHDSLETKRFF